MGNVASISSSELNQLGDEHARDQTLKQTAHLVANDIHQAWSSSTEEQYSIST